MRTFIAIDLDEKLKTILRNYILDLASTRTKVRWVKPEGMHLTLKFLGEINQTQADQVIKELQNITEHYTPFPLDLVGTGTFPPKSRHPKVIWIGLPRDPQLVTLAQKIENKMTQLGFPAEKREFAPHLTLGRVKNQAGINNLLVKLNEKQNYHFGGMIVKKITFFKSILKPTGAEYTPLQEFEFPCFT